MNQFDKVTLELNRKITSLEEESAALKDRVAQLQGAYQLQLNINDTLHLKLQGMQSRSAALVDALVTTVPYLWNSSAIGADVVAEQTLAVIRGAK